MAYLIFVSLVWAFSFGLIKDQLAGLDANFVAAARLTISLVIFLPFLRLRGVPARLRLRLLLTGAVQYGLMYVAYTYSFQFLAAHEVALFTIFTPLYVTLVNDLFQRRFHAVSLMATLLAVAGTAIVKQGSLLQPELLTGFLIVQLSNLAFAFGQVNYKEALKDRTGFNDAAVFGLLYLGGVIAAGVPALITTPWQSLALTGSQILALLYLGAIASGICFFLWNVGARKVHTGTLAVFNNLKIPLGVTASLLFFGERTSIPHLLAGGAVMLAALVINERSARRTALPEQAAASERADL